MAQMMRAILLASATAATFSGLRASNCKSQGGAAHSLRFDAPLDLLDDGGSAEHQRLA